MNKTQVICIGEALIDRISNKKNLTFEDYLGGAPANVACALSKLGISSAFVGRLGDDQFGQQFINTFNQLGIDYTFLQIDNHYPTRVVNVLRNELGERTFVGFENSSNSFFADELLEKSIIKKNLLDLNSMFLNTKFIITGTILLASEKSSESLKFFLNHAKNFDIKIVIDLNWREIFWPDLSAGKTPNKDQIRKIMDLLAYSDIIKLAQEEAFLFFNNCDPYMISKNFPHEPDILITDGSEPIKWFINGMRGLTNIIHTDDEIIDTTGAGDSFLAGFISQMLISSEMQDRLVIENNVKFASTCGLLTCLGKGAIEAQPDFKSVQSFLKNFGS